MSNNLKNMKILYVAPYPPCRNGIADYAWNFNKNLIEAGIETTILFEDEKEWSKFSIVKLFREYRKLRTIVKSNKYSVIHIESGGSLIREFFFSFFLSRIIKDSPKLAITVHDPPTLIDTDFLGKFFLGLKRKKAKTIISLLLIAIKPLYLKFIKGIISWMHQSIYNKVHVVFTFTRKGIISINNSFWVGRKVKVIPHGELASTKKITTKSNSTILLEKNPEKTVIAMLGFIAPGKGIETFLESISYFVPRLRPDLRNSFEAWICGGITNERDANYHDYINEIVKATNHWGGNISMKGFIPEESMDSFLSQIDILVVPTQSTAIFPTSGSLIRGMAAGKAIVVSDVRGYDHEIIDGKTGLLFNGSSRQLSSKLFRLLINPSLRIELGNNARNHIKQTHSWPIIIHLVSKAYFDS